MNVLGRHKSVSLTGIVTTDLPVRNFVATRNMVSRYNSLSLVFLFLRRRGMCLDLENWMQSCKSTVIEAYVMVKNQESVVLLWLNKIKVYIYEKKSYVLQK